MTTETRIAVFASGGGSNLGAIFSYLDGLADRRSGVVALVASDRPAGALDRARARSVPAHIIMDPGDGASVDALLNEHEIELVVLSGYLRLVPTEVTRRFRGRMMNVHPTLLPAFGGRGMYGMRAHRAVLAAGVRITGASVHFVDEVYDQGPIIAQWPVPIVDGDTAESLAARVLEVEHALYPRTVNAVAAGRISLAENNVVRIAAQPRPEAAFAFAPPASMSIAESIDAMFGSST